MRITNKIMQRNNLANINTNKIYQDTLSTQMSTQKKISRPSDDPVVAIRALRLRSNVTEISQYYSKNIPDAESWISVTEDALKNHSTIVTSMIKQCTKGSNGDLKSVDRQIILEQLQALSDEVYSTANADYAGRYVFTGYRTDTPLSFIKAEQTEYTITEQIRSDALDTVTKVDMGSVLDLTESNFNSAGYKDINEQDISSVDVYRFRLAYSSCKVDAAPSMELGDGTTWEASEFQIVHSYDDPYTKAAGDANKDALIYVPETGEVLMGKDRYDTLMALRDDVNTTADESEIRVTYQKAEWKAGDLRPEHYFYCEADGITYNEKYLDGTAERQDIEYDVGFNQTIRVNSTADECFQHGIGRTVDDLVSAMQEVVDLEEVKSRLEAAATHATGEEAKTLEAQIAALDKTITLSKDKCQKMFEKSITTFQKYLDDTNLCITNCGTRSSKLNLIKNRMQNQKTTFETLKSENEDADITEVAIQLNSAELTYEAALMATGKVMQTTLLNFI